MGSNFDAKHDLYKVLLKCFVSVLIVYLIFIPVVYVGNLLYRDWNGAEWVLIFAYLSRFLAVICIGVHHRRKNQSILTGGGNRYFTIPICSLLVVSLVLHLEDLPHKWYMTWATTLHIYDIFVGNLFFIVLIEQLFNNYLITSFLTCSIIVFFKPLKKCKRPI